MTQEIDYHFLPLVVEPDELEKHLLNEKLLIVDLCKPEVYAQAHIPGAVHLDYSQIIAKNGMTGGLLPDAAQLSVVFSGIGWGSSRSLLADRADFAPGPIHPAASSVAIAAAFRLS